MASLDDRIYACALANAIKYNGKVNVGAVLGKMLAEQPELKKDVPGVAKRIAEIVKRVEALSVEQQRAELETRAPDLLEAKVEKAKSLIDLPDAVKGKVVMRLAPSPSGPLHIGHAYVLSLNSELCRKYNGKLLLRLEDTNPENLDLQAYKLIPDDAQWLTKKNVKRVIVQSERLRLYYPYAEKLVHLGKAYVCTCDPEVFRKLIAEMQSCPCRALPVSEQVVRWKKMFKGYKMGEAVLRVKTDIQHPNPAIRDWPAFRINEHAHPRVGKKHRVWPLMNFAVAIDDHLLGVTHTVRGKDHKDNEKRQKYIFDYFGWKAPVHLYVGRINFEGFELSTTETRKKIEQGLYSGWDDIRLPFLRAFRRRGYQPDAFVKFALEMGVAENDKTMPQHEFYKLLEHWNKELVDPAARRVFLVLDPIEVEIKDAPKQSVALLVHPDVPKRGRRLLKTHTLFYLAKDDAKHLADGKVHRLMDCLNFVRKGSLFMFASKDYDAFRNAAQKGTIMHYLPVSKDVVPVEVMFPNRSVVKGFGEASLKKVKVGDVVQAERVGFVRLDAVKNGVYQFWFAHK